MRLRRPGARSRPEVVVTGGGTAGHVLPALAIADALVASGVSRSKVRFVGARRGMERRLVPAAGYGLVLLPGRGIERRLSLRAASAVLGLASAFVAALCVLGAARPRIVVTVGGYAGAAAGLAAVCLRIPVLVVNLDAVPGAANRLVGRFATRCAVAFEGSGLPRTVLTGAPVSTEVLAAARSTATRTERREALGLEAGRMLVVVVGGSLGARRLNDAALGLAAALSERSDVTVFHISGRRDYDEVRSSAPVARGGGAGGLEYRLVDYSAALPELYAVCDLALCRAGASTVAELATLGVPSILVPLPGAPGDHQRRNADALVRAGAALVVEDADASAGRLAPVIVELLGDDERRGEMAAAARGLGRLDAARAIATLARDLGDDAGGPR